ncbi:MAG: hypothetical protein CMR00_12790 [[Chlorobium] sp. 445]|nr:MAG: hypothetical protein CMR00_12790 [[Chlorobium] sp. 445]
MADREPIRAKITKQREESIAIVGDANLNRTILEITPIISAIQPEIKMVDANLAFRFADLQSEANTHTSLATFFGGIGASSLLSAIVTLFTEPINPVLLTVHITLTAMALLVTGIFAYLADRAGKRVNEIKQQLQPDSTSR